MLVATQQLARSERADDAALKKLLSLFGTLAFALSFIWTYGCGGGASSRPPPPPSISVSVLPNAVTIQAGATALLTASVANDASNSGVTWALSCSVAPSPCGMLSATSGSATTYSPPNPLPSSGVTITVTATSIADRSKLNTATVIPVGHITGYDVGVDYHAYGLDIDQTGFIAIYNQPQVRQTVQAQLQGMADRGASFIHTSIWVAKGPGNSNAQVTFPLTDQEQANILAYAQDVASVIGATGNRLRLEIALMWLGAADFTIGSPTTSLGSSNLSAADFTSRVQTTVDKVLAAVSDVTRSDGVRVVDTILFAPEIAIPAPGEIYGTPNAGWFLTTSYPYFVASTSQVGIRPSLYFAADCRQLAILDDTYVDSSYSILNGHRSAFWAYRGLKFFVDNGLPMPTGHIDFDCYIDSNGATYTQLLQRVLDDVDATLPSLGAPKFYDFPETYYFADPALRHQYGQAFASQAAQNLRMQRVSFWTTPGGGPNNIELPSTYPFTIEDFLPPSP